MAGGLALRERLRGLSLTPTITQVGVLQEMVYPRSTAGLEPWKTHFPLEKMSYPLTPTRGIFFSPSKTLEWISFAYLFPGVL